MKITKYTGNGERGDMIYYDLTELHPLALEAIYNGLELLEAQNKGNTVSFRVRDAIKAFTESSPKSITDNGTHDDAGGAKK